MTKNPDYNLLYVIFEQHLFNFQDTNIDRKTFTTNVANEYVSQLRKMNISVPKALEAAIVEEISFQVNTMLVKKIYGCLTIDEFKNSIPETAKRRARSRYAKIKSNSK